MASTSINIKVIFSAKGGDRVVELNGLSNSTTIGEVKNRLSVQANSRFGRVDQFENWDNRRTLADYFVRNNESFSCVNQCMMEEGQSSYDDYDQWLAEYRQK